MHIRKLRWGFLLLLVSLCPQLFAQTLIADFSATDTAGCGPLTVTFSDQSQGNVTDIQWVIDGVVINNDPNPIQIFGQAGCHDVTLIVSDGTSSDTLSRPCYIEVFDRPAVDLSFSPVDGCEPLSVQLQDQSTANSDSIADWLWEIDNVFYNGPNPVATIDSAGLYDIRLVVTNSDGCLSFVELQDTIEVFRAPVADFTQTDSTACAAPLQVQFTNTTQTNGLSNLTYKWIFSGGIPDTIIAPIPSPVNYLNPGSYDVSLIVSAPNGCVDTVVKPSLIAIGNVVADFQFDSVVCAGETVDFLESSVGGASIFEWDFDCNAGGTLDATGGNVSTTYAAAGTYCVELRAINPAGCADTIQYTIEVLELPQVDFSIDDPTQCALPATVTVIDLSTNTTSRSWDFANAQPNSSTDSIVNVTFTGSGLKPICLTVTNADGCAATLCDTVRIDEPEVDFGASVFEGCTPLPIQLSDLSTSNDSIVSWNWTISPAAGVTPSTSTQQNPSITLNNQGAYNVKLVIVTADGCTDSLVRNGYIRAGDIPVPDFFASDTFLCVNESVDFFADSVANNWDFYWDFTYDGTFEIAETGPNPTYAYQDTGTFHVALAIENFGCTDTFIRFDYMYIIPPKAEFEIDPTQVCGIPATFNLQDTSIQADVWEWYFDGNLFSNAQQPGSYTYQSGPPGTYWVNLVVKDTSSGCEDTASVSVTIGDPQAEFDTNDSLGCHAYSVQIANQSQYAGSFEWWFEGNPNGPTSTQFNGNHTYPDNGLYDVGLVAVDNNGCRDTLIKQQYIEVIGPESEFTGNPLGGCTPLTTNFVEQAILWNNTPITAWQWSFGDSASGANNTANIQAPNHIFNDTGRYDISLIVMDSIGCSDTLTKPEYVLATFPSPDFAVDDSSTCPSNPLNFSNLSEGIGLTYDWNFGDGNTSTQANPSHAYVLPGDYTVSLITTDIHGCQDSIVKLDFIHVDDFQADFTADNQFAICPPLPVQFTDLTQPAGVSSAWFWNFGDGPDTVNVQNPDRIFFIPDSFDISLVAVHEDGCRDTMVKDDYIIVRGPYGAYQISPTAACPGDTITYTIFTERASEVEIQFSDIVSGVDIAPTNNLLSDTVIIKHVFHTPGLHCPTVVVGDNQACRLQLPDAACVRIYDRPTAIFTPQSSAGCTPFSLNLSDLSIAGDTALAAWDWNLTDTLISQQNPTHTFDSAAIYPLELVVTDAFGCKDTAYGVSQAYPLPEVDFIASDTFNCAPIDINFSDLTQADTAIASWSWNFGDGGIDTVQNPLHAYMQDGLYSVSLAVVDERGCAGSLVKPDYIYLRHPEAAFFSDTIEGCEPFSIVLQDNSTTDTTLAWFDWSIYTQGNLVGGNASPADSFPFLFTDSGVYDVQLIITDEFGCMDTQYIPEYIEIRETLTPDPMEILRVSVENDSSVLIEYAIYPLTDFLEYTVYRMDANGNYQPIATISNQNTSSYLDTGGALACNQNVYCYKVQVQNDCLQFSRLEDTQEHCTVELQTSSEIDAIRLDWNAYVGWDTVQAYQIYRANNYDPAAASFLAQVDGNTLTYTDSATFCHDSIFYRVQAVEGGGNQQVSWSDTSGNKPIHLPPTEQLDVKYATVLEDSIVEVAWDMYTGYKPATYTLYKSLDGISWNDIETFPFTTLSALDVDVEVDERSYYYRLIVTDSCGDQSQLGLHGKTILLQTSLGPNFDDHPVLTWSAYEEWEAGVAAYQVEILNDATGLFELVTTLGANQFGYTDTRSQLNQPYYCYRIRAINAADPNIQSVSNVSCEVFGPILYAPNAFTPNGDGYNDIFYVKGPNIQTVSFTIYDRWGKIVYEGNSLEEGWDGKKNGKAVPEGVFVFYVSGTGYNGVKVERSGTVTLIR